MLQSLDFTKHFHMPGCEHHILNVLGFKCDFFPPGPKDYKCNISAKGQYPAHKLPGGFLILSIPSRGNTLGRRGHQDSSDTRRYFTSLWDPAGQSFYVQCNSLTAAREELKLLELQMHQSEKEDPHLCQSCLGER